MTRLAHHRRPRTASLVAVLVTLVVALVVPAWPADAQDATVQRIAGATRYETAVAVSEQMPYYQHREDVIVATGLDYPDALAAGPAAYHTDSRPGALLLVGRDSIPAVTASRLDQLTPRTIYLVGGRAAVSEGVEAQLTRHADQVVRLSGATRYDTAAAVSRTFFPGTGDVVVATGHDYPDALAGTPVARRAGAPILLTGRTSLPAPTEQELRRRSPSRVWIMGGTAAISEAVVERIRAVTGASVPRIAGSNRFETAVEAAVLIPGNQVFVATGSNYPDGLTGGALAGVGAGVHRPDNPVLLVTRDSLPRATRLELSRRGPTEIKVIGGGAAISDRTAYELAHYRGTRCPPSC